MKTLTIVGVCLMILGGALLAYRGFSYTREEQVLKIGPIEANAQVTERVNIPTIVSWVILGAGLVMLVGGLAKTRSHA